MKDLRLNVDIARDFVRRAMQGYGFTAQEGETTADVLLTADLYGIQSHGIHRLVRYANAVREGSIDPKAQVTTVFETPLSAVWDAPKTLGQSVAHRGMQTAIDKARQHGFGIVTVRGSNHYGIAGYYTMMAVAADMIGLCMTNTEAIAIPTYGKQAMLGTNPIAVAMPADPVPFWYDAATTVVARGKVEVYNKAEKPLPTGWAADETGADCPDSGRVLRNIIGKVGGGIFPLGGATEETGSHKGYGLGLIVEMMTAILSGGTTSPHVKHSGNADTSFTFAAMDYGLFGDKRVIMMIESAGFEVIDLGVDVPTERFVEAVRENPGTNLVGVSALLTTTMPAMEKTVALLNQQDFRKDIKIMVGGAPITQAFADKIGADAYTVDAASAAIMAKKLVRA